MSEYYFKQKPINNKSEDYVFYKLTSKGEIIAISINKMTISKPKTCNIQLGFEIIQKEEYESNLNKILKQL